MKYLNIKILLTFVFWLTFLGSWSQLQIGDAGVIPDTIKINANYANYPQMARWAEAGVRGGIPFLNSFTKVQILDPGTSADINVALAELEASLSGDELGLLILRNGSYQIQSEVKMRSKVSILGESRDGVVCTINFQSGYGFHFNTVNMSGIYRLTIQGGWGQPKYNWNYSIDANDEMPDNGNISVRFRESMDCWLDQVNIFNSGRDPMRCVGSHTTFRDLKVVGAHRKAGGAQGYFLIQGPDNLVIGCEMTYLRHISIQGPAAEYNVVYDNNFYQEVSFHTEDNGNNLITENRITLPEDMPPVETGGPYPETNTNLPNYFAIMGPWSSVHIVSSNPNFLFRNKCLQLNHDFGTKTPWSDPNVVYSGPIKIGHTPSDHINNFPIFSETAPIGNALYAIQGANLPSISGYGRSPKLEFLLPLGRSSPKGNQLIVQLEASDDYQIDHVELFVDDQFLGTKQVEPYLWTNETILKNLTVGPHKLKAIAIDDEGLQTERLLDFEIIEDNNSPQTYMETFNNMVLTDWGSETFIGDNGWVWNINAKGINGDIEGRGVYYHKQVTGIKSSVLKGGIDRLSVECVNKFNANERVVELLVNDKVVHTQIQSGQNQQYKVEVLNLNLAGDFTISIRNASVAADESDLRTVSFDNISWTTLGSKTNYKPIMTFNKPFENQNFRDSEAVEVEVLAYDDVSIAKVELYLNNVLLSADTEAPYLWGADFVELQNLMDGTNVIKAVAFDDELLTSERVIIVTKGLNKPPLIRIKSPVSGSKMKNINGVDIEVSDDNGLKKSELWLDGVLISSKQVAPFGWAPDETLESLTDLVSGQHSLLVIAEDLEGIASQRESRVNLNEPPAIVINSPKQGETYGITNELTVNITITDDFDEVMKSELYLDDQLISTLSESPFGWSEVSEMAGFSNLSTGNHKLSVLAADLDGLESETLVDFRFENMTLANAKDGQILIFPNPFNDHLIMQNAGQDSLIIQILNMEGSILYEKHTNRSSSLFDLPGLKNGIYVLQIINNGKRETYKLIKE